MSEKCFSFQDVCHLLGVHRSTLARWINPTSRYFDPTFPAPIPIGLRKKVFLPERLHQWLISKGRVPGKPMDD